MAPLIHCIYTSRATPAFEERDLPKLLELARRNNSARGITGMLLYVERNFFQVLEGEEQAVTEVFDIIHGDTRHCSVTQIIREPVFERAFSEWTMGFASLDFSEVKSHVGENDFFATGTCLEQLGPGRARKLLDAFRQGRWRAEETARLRTHRRMA